MSIFERVKALNFPIGKYVVVGGVMEAHGIRPANDIDIVVTKDFFDELLKQKWDEIKTYPEYSYGVKRTLKRAGLDVLSHYAVEDKYYCLAEKLIAEAEIINGVPFIPLGELLKWKKAKNREKDQKDIELIHNYLSTKNSAPGIK